MTAITRSDSSARREPAPVSASVEKRLATYALVAGAGLLAAAKPADAASVIVYRVCNTNCLLTNGTMDLDLDNNGVVDFTLTNKMIFNSTSYGRQMRMDDGPTGPGNDVVAGPLGAGVHIGPAGPFNGLPWFIGTMYNSGVAQYGWVTGTGFAGLRFDIGGAPHYGWIRFSVNNTTDLNGTIRVIDYAYRAGANDPIDTADIPEPGSLSLLALGAIGLAAWRRKRTA